MKKELVRDLENMETIMEKTADRCDIWQDRFIYWIAKAIYDMGKAIIRLQMARD